MARVKPIDGGVVLVTGASSGIGEAIARRVAGRAKAIVLVARRKDRLEKLAQELEAAHRAHGLAVHVHAVDVTDVTAVDRMIGDVTRDVGGVDVLVNNAGFGDMGVFDLADWDKTRRMIDINVTSLTYLTHRLVVPMVARGRGAVLNVSSAFGMTFLPGFAAYIGTKHYVTGFSEGLRLDLVGTGVTVTQLCPGPVDTEFESHLGNFTGLPPPSVVLISADHCARAGVRALDRGRALVVPGVVMWLVVGVGRITPRWIQRLFVAPLSKLLRKRQIAAAETIP